jgi:hypothetical protein
MIFCYFVVFVCLKSASYATPIPYLLITEHLYSGSLCSDNSLFWKRQFRYSLNTEPEELHETMRLLQEKFCYDFTLELFQKELQDFYDWLDRSERDFNKSVALTEDDFLRETSCVPWDYCWPTITVYEDCILRHNGTWLRVDNPLCEK